jgi:hypothetical protein
VSGWPLRGSSNAIIRVHDVKDDKPQHPRGDTLLPPAPPKARTGLTTALKRGRVEAHLPRRCGNLA